MSKLSVFPERQLKLSSSSESKNNPAMQNLKLSQHLRFLWFIQSDLLKKKTLGLSFSLNAATQNGKLT